MRRVLIKLLPIYFCFIANTIWAAPAYDTTSVQSPGFFPWPFRATAWGLAGNRNVGIGDAMLPLFGNDVGMFFGDAQVKYAADSNWVDSFGGGYRYVYDCKRIFGAYVFADHNVFKNVNTNQSTFWMVSPGIESMGNSWDFRVNGYFPVSSQTENKGTFFGDQIGINNAVVFQGHSQFDQLFTITNNVGPGVDGEIGYAFPIWHRTPRFYVGGYYFSPKNSSNIRGIAGRLEVPLNHYFALTAADTYDNTVNNSFEAGLRVTIGGNTDDQTSQDIERRIVDPISRNLATLSQGTGAPVTTETVANGLALERTNIYFFSASPTTPTLLTSADVGATQNGLLGATTSNFNPSLGNANCTFEHPCAGSSFTQATVNSINVFAPGTNFYFTPGTYNISSGLTLNGGQSMFGRTENYVMPAEGLTRALFLGNMNLLQGNNLLDSIQLLNSVTDSSGDGSQITALTIQNAPNVTLSNDSISAIAAEAGSLNDGVNMATAIYATNSQVHIINSTVNALATVQGNNGGSSFNFASGIGANNNATTTNFSNNVFIINNSHISASATVGGESDDANYATAIGGQTETGNANFNNNQFVVTVSTISGTASIGGENLGNNFATGIGGNTLAGNAIFSNNQFLLSGTRINGTASVQGDSAVFNFANGIGGNAPILGSVAFSNNQFTLNNSVVVGNATLIGNNTTGALNLVNGIGGNDSGADSRFSNNQFTLSTGNVTSTALVSSGNAGGTNQATGVNMSSTGNVMNIDNLSTLNVLSEVDGNNTGSNTAIGLNVGAGSTLNSINSIINVIAKAPRGTGNTALATTGAGTINRFNTRFNVTTTN